MADLIQRMYLVLHVLFPLTVVYLFFSTWSRIFMLVAEGLSLSSLFSDVSAPVFSNCSNDIVAIADRGTTSTRVTWPHPTAADNSGLTPNITHIGKQPNGIFPAGRHKIRYLASDKSRNVAECKFDVFVSGTVITLDAADRFKLFFLFCFNIWFSYIYVCPRAHLARGLHQPFKTIAFCVIDESQAR